MAPKGNGSGRGITRRPASFEDVLNEELSHFGQETAGAPSADTHPVDQARDCHSHYAADVIAKAHEAKLSGIAFSGGGIRSATFNLGVLQALAKLDLLKEFKYLSTVSGGGYIGSWLVAWIHRESEHPGPVTGGDQSRTPMEKVRDQLVAAAGEDKHKRNQPLGALQPDPPPIQHLREYSNYLTPRRGLWSTDTWTLGATYIRNLLLTLTILLGTVISLVLLGQAVVAGFHELSGMLTDAGRIYSGYYFVLVALMAVASLMLGLELSSGRATTATHAAPAYAAVVLSLLAAITATMWLLSWPGHLAPGWKPLVGAFFALVFATIVFGFSGRWAGNHFLSGGKSVRPRAKSWSEHFWMVLGGLLALAVLGLSWWGLALWFETDLFSPARLNLAVWGAPLIVLTFTLSGAVSVGVGGAAYSEVEREWLARFFAALAKVTVMYTLFMAFVVYSDDLVRALPRVIETALSTDDGKKVVVADRGLWGTIAGLWAILSSAGAYLAAHTPSRQTASGRWLRNLLIAIAPVVFLAGLLILVASATTHTVHGLAGFATEAGGTGDLLENSGYWATALGLGVLMAVATLAWSARVGVNDFSLHALYGNRLVRAYLGASNLRRRAHPFTGFDQGDNSVRMADLAPKSAHGNGPYPIVNTAVNLVSSRRLAWQKRKAASFVFTPRFSGYEFCDDEDGDDGKKTIRVGGYASSDLYCAGRGRGVSLGKAMTISGAAASPNMGYYSSPALTFLMTMFNVRLGWWLPNTAKRNASLLRKRGPGIGLVYLVAEALGLTNARRNYLYLSDGGHFENLGIYELVRRRCHFVLVSDAEADPEFRFSGLGNAIEKCRTDLGVPIEIDVSQIKPAPGTKHSRWGCAVGCIRYSEADPGQHDGTLLYIKSTLIGDEPQDVSTYADSHASFPHQTTADQWFDESQFESYRALGQHLATKVLHNAVEIERHRRASGEHRLQRIFLELRKQWYAPEIQTKGDSISHSARLEGLLETLRNDPHLAFLDSQLYPNLVRVAGRYAGKPWSWLGLDEARRRTIQSPKDPTELRAAFYFCKELLLLMEEVFQDRHLDTEYLAPDNRGWMNLFRRWALSGMFQFTWTMTAGTYSSRFQSFCEYHLQLDSGAPHFGDRICLRAIVSGNCKNPDVRIEGRSCEGGSDESANDWIQQAEDAGLHLYQRWLIQEFITAYVYLDGVCDQKSTSVEFEVRPLELNVDYVLDFEHGGEMPIIAGFVVIGPDPENPHRRGVVYFRIRSSMRNMDLARKAFIEMRRALPDVASICLAEELPAVRHVQAMSVLQRRAYDEIHTVNRENLERCRWFSTLAEDPDSTHRDTRTPD